MADQPAHSPKPKQQPGESCPHARQIDQCQATGQPSTLFPTAGREDRERKSIVTDARAQCSGCWTPGLVPTRGSRCLGKRSDWTSVSRRSSRGKGKNATSGIIARDATSATARDQESPRGLPADQHRKTTRLRKMAVDRVASNKIEPARSSHTHMPRTFCEERICKAPLFDRISRDIVESSRQSQGRKS